MTCRRKLKLELVDASKLEPAARAADPAEHEKAWRLVREAAGILVPGGFGTRGTEGMILTIRWARESHKPFLGICLGMQLAVVEFARHVCGISDATSAEFDTDADENTKRRDDVIIYMPELDRSQLGGTMRLGLRPTHFCSGTEGSKVRRLYATQKLVFDETTSPDALPSPNSEIMPDADQEPPSELVVQERHRHRYEVNPAYAQTLENCGMCVVGKDEAGIRTEVVEINDHPWFVGVQFHPEYTSKVLEPSRCILGFFAASAGCLADLK
jgi:CTP synthase